jgi:transglutaminase-like putative cysteine protease
MRALLLCVVLCGCATANFAPLDVKALPPATDFPGAKWVVLLNEQEARFVPGAEGPEVVTTERWRIKVLRATEVPRVQVSYSRTFEEVVSIRGRIITPAGEVRPLDVSKQLDVPAFSNSILFSDARVTVVPVPPVPVGGVFEYEVVTKHRNMQHFVVAQHFGGTEPVEVDRLVALAPKGWEVRWKLLAYDTATMEPVVTERDGLQQWTFERTHLPAFEAEPSGPALRFRLPRLVMRLETWLDSAGAAHHPPSTPEELSRMLAKGGASASQATPDIEATVKQVLVGVEDTPEAKARALYEYTCREVQYCAIEIGFGGWFPHAAKDVHAARYGDCKDKANYLRTLLNVAGLTAYSAAIYSHDGTPQEFSLPSLGVNFNHQILAVELPQGLVFADPTWRSVPSGDLPPNDQGAPVLVISDKGHELQRTPESKPQDNTEHQRLTLTLDRGGDASGRFHVTASGARALPWKARWLEGTGTAKRWVEDQLWLRAPLVREVKPVERHDFARTVDVEGELGARRIAFDAGPGRLVIRPVDVFSPWVQTWSTGRKSPVVSRFVDTRTVTLELKVPAGAALEAGGGERLVEGPNGTWKLSAKLEGGVLTVERRFEKKQRRLQVSALNDFNRFVREVLLAESKPLLLTVPPVTASVGGAP